MLRLTLCFAFASALMCTRALAESGDDAPQTIYRYRAPGGRIVFTNAVEQVPLAERAAAEVDLRKVKLNSEIGNQLEQRLEEEHAALTQSKYCKDLRAAANLGFLERAWEDFAPLIVCGGLLLAFVFFTPAALRSFGAPAWARVLCMAIPSLAVAGLLMFAMTYTSRTMTLLKSEAKPCIASSFASLASQPNVLAARMKLVENLKQQIAKIDAEAK